MNESPSTSPFDQVPQPGEVSRLLGATGDDTVARRWEIPAESEVEPTLETRIGDRVNGVAQDVEHAASSTVPLIEAFADQARGGVGEALTASANLRGALEKGVADADQEQDLEKITKFGDFYEGGIARARQAQDVVTDKARGNAEVMDFASQEARPGQPHGDERVELACQDISVELARLGITMGAEGAAIRRLPDGSDLSIAAKHAGRWMQLAGEAGGDEDRQQALTYARGWLDTATEQLRHISATLPDVGGEARVAKENLAITAEKLRSLKVDLAGKSPE